MAWTRTKKKALGYDGVHRNGNMITNLLKSFNHLLKGAHAMSISALVQLTFYRCNSYWVKRRRKANAKIQRGDIWPCQLRLNWQWAGIDQEIILQCYLTLARSVQGQL
jgi:hypothetical protein